MAEDLPPREILEQLVERLDRLERLLQANTQRLHAVEQRLGIDADTRPATAPPRPRTHDWLAEQREEQARAIHTTEAAPSRPDAASRSDAASAGSQASTAQTSSSGAQASAASAAASPASGNGAAGGRVFEAAGARAGKPRDIESLIGGSWFNWIGIIAFTFGVAFFLKLAFDSQWVGPEARVALGALAGAGLVYLGERLRARGLRQYAFVIAGGGVLILYLSTYAAYDFYKLVPHPVAFLLMAALTAGAVVLAVRHDALPVAILGLVGGFMTPVLLSTGVDNQVALFTYIALLDAGVLAVAYFKRWRSLDFLSFAGTVLMTAGWWLIHYRAEKLWTTLAFVSVLFVLYALLAVFHNVLRARASRWFDVALLAANATLYFATSYGLLVGAGYEQKAPASHALLLSTFFAGLFHTAWRWSREDRLLAYSYVGAAVTFLTAAVAIQLELQWVTIAWAVEALALTWVGVRAPQRAARHAALGVFCAAVVHWFVWDMGEFAYGVDAGFVPVLNKRALGCAVLVGALAAAARVYRRARFVEEGERATATTFFILAGNALGFTLLSLDVNDYFNSRLSGERPDDGGARSRVENARLFSMTALWAFYGATALALGVIRRITVLRYGALALLVAACCLLLFNTPYGAAVRVPVFNHTFMGYAVLVFALGASARFYARAGEGGTDEREVVLPALVVAANALALVALSVEAAGYFEARMRPEMDAAALRDLGLAKQLSTSVVWAVYGGALLLVGRLRGARLLRLLALALLSLTTLKVFFWDLASLDRVYRIISFIVLGAILLAVSYLYQKSQQREKPGEEG